MASATKEVNFSISFISNLNLYSHMCIDSIHSFLGLLLCTEHC